jgi:hypothetical protein
MEFAHGGMIPDKDVFENDGAASRVNTGWGKVIMRAQGGVIPAGNGPASAHGKFLAMKKGGEVSGHASVKGDSYANDTRKVLLSPGEVVIPRHIMQGKDAAKKASAFVAAILAKNGAPK